MSIDQRKKGGQEGKKKERKEGGKRKEGGEEGKTPEEARGLGSIHN
jgi:hypothetical protein